ncbi:MAG: SRPBCC domain-containing protein [Bacteroidales bacterium]|nr:SRPBCC domain-containing protein [Bacteroidales bacterium]
MNKEINTEIIIRTTPEEVWNILTDFQNYPKWNPFIHSLTGDVAVRNRIKVLLVPPGSKGMTFKPVVLVYEPNKEFRWLGHLLLPGLFDGAHRFEIIDNGDDTVTFRQSEQFSGLLVSWFMKTQSENTKKGFEALNQKIKERAENM